MKVTREQLEDGSKVVYVNYTKEDIEEMKQEAEKDAKDKQDNRLLSADNA